MKMLKRYKLKAELYNCCDCSLQSGIHFCHNSEKKAVLESWEHPKGEWVKFEDVEIFAMAKMNEMVRPLKIKGSDTPSASLNNRDGENIS